MDRKQQIDQLSSERKQIVNRVASVARSQDDAEDAVQNAFLAMLTYGQEIENPKGFLEHVSSRAISSMNTRSESGVRTVEGQRLDQRGSRSHPEIDLSALIEMVPMNTEELETLILMIAGVECDEAAILCGVTFKGVSARRCRLLRRLREVPGPLKEELLGAISA